MTIAELITAINLLTPDELSVLVSEINKLIPPVPIPKVSVEKSSAAFSTLTNASLFLGILKPLKKGESTTDRWMEEKRKLTAKQAKDFESEIKLMESRIAELGWDKPDTLTKVSEEAKPKPPGPPPKPKEPTVKPELIIGRTPYPKWWKDSLNAKIDLTAPGSLVLATVTGNLRLFVATIVLSVTGETQISFSFGNAGSSGPIYLGGENQPMGIVIAMGNSPAPCGSGNLVISATDPQENNPSVGGFATCFVEETIKQKV